MYLDLGVLIKGAGEVASGVAHRLKQSHFKVCLTEIPQPLATRRGVAFSEAVYEGEKAGGDNERFQCWSTHTLMKATLWNLGK